MKKIGWQTYLIFASFIIGIAIILIGEIRDSVFLIPSFFKPFKPLFWVGVAEILFAAWFYFTHQRFAEIKGFSTRVVVNFIISLLALIFAYEEVIFQVHYSFVLIVAVKGINIINFVYLLLKDIGIVKRTVLCALGASLCLLIPLAAFINSSLVSCGDEVVYLLNALSLAKDADLNLRNNLEEKQYKDFVSDDLKTEDWAGSWSRRIGFPLLIAPFYFLGGRLGVLFLLAALLSILGILCAWLTRTITQDNHACAFSWALCTFLSPAYYYSQAVFVELPAALLTAILLIIIIDPRSFSSMKGLALLLISALALMGLKVRFVPMLVGFAVVIVLIRAKVSKLAIKISAILMVIMLSIVAIDYFLLSGAYIWRYLGAHHVWYSLLHFDGYFLRGLLGILFDAEFGLFMHFPLFWIALLGLPALLIKGKEYRAAILLPAAFYLFILLKLRGYFWYGGLNPPGRFIVALTPMLVIIAAFGYLELRRYKAGIVFNLLVVISALKLTWLTCIPRFRLNAAIGITRIDELLDRLLNEPLLQAFPSMIRGDTWSYLFVIISSLGIIGLFFVQRDLKPAMMTILSYAATLTICIAIAVGSLVSLNRWIEAEILVISSRNISDHYLEDYDDRLRQSLHDWQKMPLVIRAYKQGKLDLFWSDWSDERIDELSMEEMYQENLLELYFFLSQTDRISHGLREMTARLRPRDRFSLEDLSISPGSYLVIKARKDWGCYGIDHPSLEVRCQENNIVHKVMIDDRALNYFSIYTHDCKPLYLLNPKMSKCDIYIDKIGIFEDEPNLSVMPTVDSNIIYRPGSWIPGDKLDVINGYAVPWPGGIAFSNNATVGCQVECMPGDYNLTAVIMATPKSFGETALTLKVDNRKIGEYVPRSSAWEAARFSVPLKASGIHTIKLRQRYPTENPSALYIMAIRQLRIE